MVKKDFKQYIPEFDYKVRNYEPFRSPPTNDLCGHCKDYYKMLFQEGKVDSPNPPNCLGHLQELIKTVVDTVDDDEEVKNEIVLSMDPMAWAEYHFGHDKDLWNPRWYQLFADNCTAEKKLYRWGRRMGKSILMVIETLHAAYTNRNYNVLVAGPQERHVHKLFEEMHKYINASSEIFQSVAGSTKNPLQINFNNGSSIKGFSIGAQQADAATKVRGQDANLIVIDEFDFIGDKEIDVLMAIRLSHPDVKLLVSTTPSGQRKKFYEYVTNKRTGWKEFWFTSKEIPHYSEELEASFREEYDDFRYGHEILAEFGESESGVFKSRYINQSLREYNMIDCAPESGASYILGVDWNKQHGTHMVILRVMGGFMQLVQKIIIPESEYMQTEAVNRIIMLNEQWRFKYLFLDAGYGTVQTEELKKYGLSNPSSGLHHKTKAIPMQKKIEVINPIDGQKEGKFAKHFLVQQTAKLLEDGRLILPISEDTSTTKSTEVQGLVQQMRNYQVIGVSVYGMPQYTKDNEHTLVAYMLACGGWIMEEGPFSKHDFVAQMITKPTPGLHNPLHPTPGPNGTISESQYHEYVQALQAKKRESSFSRTIPQRGALGKRDLKRGGIGRRNIGGTGFNRRSF